MVSNIVDRLSNAVFPGYGTKTPVLAASTGNISLSGTQTIDGISASSGDRVLAWQQNSTYQNGVYVVSGSSWQRDADFTKNTDVTLGCLVPVSLGTQYGGRLGQVTSTGSGRNGRHVFSGSSTSDNILFTMRTISPSSDAIIPSTNITGNFASTNFNGGTNASSATVWLGNRTWGTFDSTNLTGNVRSTNFNSGVSASTNTFWRGDGAWGTVTSTLGGTVTAISHSSGVGGGVITSSGDVGLDFGNLPTLSTGTAGQVFVGVYASSTAQHFKMLPSALPGLSAGSGPSLFAYPAIAGGIF